jgi:nucleoid-associated protein YgaU
LENGLQMNQRVVQVIIAIVGLGVGLASGVVITNSKSKAVIADLQSKAQQSEAASQKRISSYDVTMNRLNNEMQRTKIELQQAKTELEKLNRPAPAAEVVATAAAENKKTAAVSDNNSIPGTAKLYTVKDGDSLWKIAASQLGDGNRYKEIIKLNPNVSADGENLAVGMKLKIPTR